MTESKQYQRMILMGDPSHFSVKGGANPHTRTRWGTRRQVDRDVAIRQWNRLKDTVQDLGIRVIVVPPDAGQPGLVYPANAGYQSNVDREEKIAEKTFTLANLLPTRTGEKAHYRRVLKREGFMVAEIDEAYRFEGEADFFPAGDIFLLTHGTVEHQRFVPALALPPWKRIYGFRTDVRVELLLAPKIDRPILKLALRLETHYHGDTVLSAFGPGRRELLVYREALEPEGLRLLDEHFGSHLLPLEDEDARRYAANSFCYNRGDESFLIFPDGVTRRLLDRVRERGVTPITVDVSEFLEKGGGSVKCMIGDLGVVERRDELENGTGL